MEFWLDCGIEEHKGTEFTGNPSQTCQDIRAQIVDLMLVIEETSGDRQSHRNSSSGHHICNFINPLNLLLFSKK